MKNLKIKVIALSCAILFILFMWRSCKEDNLSYLDTNILLSNNIERVKNSYREETAITQSLELDNQRLVKQLKASEAVEKNLRERIRNTTHAGFHTRLETVYKDSVIVDTFIIDTSGVYLKASGGDKWVKWGVTVKDSLVSLDSLKIANEITGVFNEDRKLFKKDVIELELTNHNPYTTTQSLQSFIYKPKPKRVGVGLIGGYGITQTGLSPFIGVGVSYNLINF